MRQNSVGRNNDCGNNRNNNSVFLALRGRLQLLDFRSFQACVWLWLAALGYKHMRNLGRTHRRGRRASGGADFVVQVTDSPEIQIAVQVRHWRSPINRQSVDELRGYLLRHHIPAGMIVAANSFSAQAHRAAWDYPGRPIRLVSVSRLAESLLALDLGVRAGNVDERFFQTLHGIRFASTPESPTLISQSDVVKAGPSRAADFNQPGDPDDLGPAKWLFIAWAVVVAFLMYLLYRQGVGL